MFVQTVGAKDGRSSQIKTLRSYRAKAPQSQRFHAAPRVKNEAERIHLRNADLEEQLAAEQCRWLGIIQGLTLPLPVERLGSLLLSAPAIISEREEVLGSPRMARSTLLMPG
jgi:hypothetical protein